MKIGYSKTCGASSETEDLFSFENSHGQIYFHFRKVQQTMQSPLSFYQKISLPGLRGTGRLGSNPRSYRIRAANDPRSYKFYLESGGNGSLMGHFA